MVNALEMGQSSGNEFGAGTGLEAVRAAGSAIGPLFTAQHISHHASTPKQTPKEPSASSAAPVPSLNVSIAGAAQHGLQVMRKGTDLVSECATYRYKSASTAVTRPTSSQSTT